MFACLHYQKTAVENPTASSLIRAITSQENLTVSREKLILKAAHLISQGTLMIIMKGTSFIIFFLISE